MGNGTMLLVIERKRDRQRRSEMKKKERERKVRAGLAKTNGRSIYPDQENESGFLVGCLGFFGLIG